MAIGVEVDRLHRIEIPLHFGVSRRIGSSELIRCCQRPNLTLTHSIANGSYSCATSPKS
jgi:hypothetical protein